MWSNLHTHSNYCDGKSSLNDHIGKAEALNLKSLGFSSHAPVPFDCKWCMKPEDLDHYLNTIGSLKKSTPSIELYTGLEVDYIPNVISPGNFSHQLDYTIGSIHFVDAFADGRPWEIDGPHFDFLDGLKKIFSNNYKDAFARYFELIREMIHASCPTIIGHLDKMKIQNPENKFFDESEAWYQNQVKKTIHLIKDSGALVEINTRGIYQKKSPTTYPSPWILEILNRHDIPVTLSSDAHHCDDLVNQFSTTALLMKKIGFKKIHNLCEGKWKAFTFNENGIIQ
jgi:histidinol-phosphatase (PHP family)